MASTKRRSKKIKLSRLLEFSVTPIVFAFLVFLLLYTIPSVTILNVSTAYQLVFGLSATNRNSASEEISSEGNNSAGSIDGSAGGNNIDNSNGVIGKDDSSDSNIQNNAGYNIRKPVDTFKPPIVDDKDNQGIGTPPGETGVDDQDITFPKPGDVYGQFQMENLGITNKLIYGDDDDCLLRGVGQYMGSPFPGFGGTTVVSGHVNLGFDSLKKAQRGDEVLITTSYGYYKYSVVETEIRTASSFSAFEAVKSDYDLIVYTCYRRDNSIGNINDRLFLYCEKVSGPEINK